MREGRRGYIRLFASFALTSRPSRWCWSLLGRQFVAVGRGRYVEGVDDSGQHAEIPRRGGQLDQPLRPMPFLQPVEHRLVDPVVAHQLAGVGDDVALV